MNSEFIFLRLIDISQKLVQELGVLDFLQPEFCCLTPAEYWSDLTGFIIKLNQETSDDRGSKISIIQINHSLETGEWKTTEKSIVLRRQKDDDNMDYLLQSSFRQLRLTFRACMFATKKF